MPIRRLGPTTLLAIMIQRTSVFFGFSTLALIAVLLLPLLPEYQAGWIAHILPWMVMSSAALLFTTFLSGWLEYRNYRIILTPYSIGLVTGILRRKYIHVPYRMIKKAEVITSRFSEQMGVRGILISIKGSSQVYLPLLEKYLAEKLQKHLLFHSKKDAEEALNPFARVYNF